jgi:hypothetical protein
MAKSKRVEFKTTDGITLRGDFYQAKGDKRPIVIMTAGLTLTKEHNIGAMAEKFQEGGISALAFDYRCWESSDGTSLSISNILGRARRPADVHGRTLRNTIRLLSMAKLTKTQHGITPSPPVRQRPSKATSHSGKVWMYS